MKYESNQFPKPIKEEEDKSLNMNDRAKFIFENMEEKMPNLYKLLTKK